ncbi:hypothetical protein [Mesorhizobium sp.]|uniref:hypothetical protein n=1 Tax=Mesorhizobium sp. TaxID=1871066 RepID=UPI0025E5B6C5|nr:hypothetical protein [Mesorhizobium sp.]
MRSANRPIRDALRPEFAASVYGGAISLWLWLGEAVMIGAGGLGLVPRTWGHVAVDHVGDVGPVWERPQKGFAKNSFLNEYLPICSMYGIT